ncbi:hypothetical protein D5086_030040 [Populus alba]|uniref:Uncharacterized protein n=1 Tax=Populus alba TaxID=43335 RepID=A0ACC4AMC1_POPAL
MDQITSTSSSGQLAIERTACYADEEMQGFVHACEQLYLGSGEGAAGQACETCLPSFEPDVKEKHVFEYTLAHHARKYNLNAAVAILLRSTGDDHIYILEFFLPILVKESSEQQDLVEKLKLTIKQTCKSLTMVSEKPSIRKQGSKVSKNNDKIESAPDPDGDMFIICAGNKRRKANADDPSKCISFAKKHRIKENYMSDLLCCEKAFVPVFDNERRHFFLFVLQLKRQVVEIWDSLAASCQSDWVDKRLHNLFDSENERLEVVLRLLASDVNSCRNDLASKAEAYYEQRFGNQIIENFWQEMII